MERHFALILAVCVISNKRRIDENEAGTLVCTDP